MKKLFLMSCMSFMVAFSISPQAMAIGPIYSPYNTQARYCTTTGTSLADCQQKARAICAKANNGFLTSCTMGICVVNGEYSVREMCHPSWDSILTQ